MVFDLRLTFRFFGLNLVIFAAKSPKIEPFRLFCINRTIYL